MKEKSGKDWRRDRTFLIATVISFIGNTIVVFGYFFPLNPLGASIFYAYFALGHILFWLRLPKIADMTSWTRLIRKWVQRPRKSSEPHEGQTTAPA